ncbi:MAG: MarR family transcriptional regulator, partial [Planctomycetota bacterium]
DDFGTPSGFSLELFSVPDNVPDVSLLTFTGDNNPAVAGDYTYTTPGFFLTPNTTYAWVASAPNSPINTFYAIRSTSSSNDALIDRLEKSGFVTRRPDPEDRRRTCVEATEAVYERLAKLYRGCAAQILAEFRPLRVARLEQAVGAIETLHRGCRAAVDRTRADSGI